MVLSYYELKHKGGQNGSPKQRRNEMKILAWTMIGLAFLLNPLTYLAGSVAAVATASFLRRHLHPLTAKVAPIKFVKYSDDK
jgi:hypothetical protein